MNTILSKINIPNRTSLLAAFAVLFFGSFFMYVPFIVSFYSAITPQALLMRKFELLNSNVINVYNYTEYLQGYSRGSFISQDEVHSLALVSLNVFIIGCAVFSVSLWLSLSILARRKPSLYSFFIILPLFPLMAYLQHIAVYIYTDQSFLLLFHIPFFLIVFGIISLTLQGVTIYRRLFFTLGWLVVFSFAWFMSFVNYDAYYIARSLIVAIGGVFVSYLTYYASKLRWW